MNSIWKSILIHCMLLLVAVHFCVTSSIVVNEIGYSNEQNTNAIISCSKFSDVINIRDDHQTRGERASQIKTSDLFIVAGHIIAARNRYYVTLKNQTLITSLTPDYFLSSDLKSPPSNFISNKS